MGGADPGSLPSGYGAYLIQTLLALGAVCALAWVLLKLGARRLGHLGRKGKTMRVLEQLPLEPRRAIYLVAVADRVLLVGASEGQLTLLAEVDPRSLDGRREEARPPGEEVAGTAATTTTEGRTTGP